MLIEFRTVGMIWMVDIGGLFGCRMKNKVASEKVFHLPLKQIGGMSMMKYPQYGDWCKQNVFETIKKQKIHETKPYLNNFIFNPCADLYSSGVHDYEVSDILWIINGDVDPSKSLFSAVQHAFAEKYFLLAQESNPQIHMKAIRRNDRKYTDLLFKTLENITIDQLKGMVMYALEHGTEEVEEPKIPYVKTVTGNIVKVIHSGLIEIGIIFIDYLDPESERKYISIDKFVDNLIHLSQSGIFSDTINWRYVDLFDNGKYLVEGDINHNNGYELNIAIAVKSTKDRSKVVEMLRESEE